MNASKREATRLFEILNERRHIKVIPKRRMRHSLRWTTPHLEMSLPTKEAWIQALTDAILLLKDEEFEKMVKRMREGKGMVGIEKDG